MVLYQSCFFKGGDILEVLNGLLGFAGAISSIIDYALAFLEDLLPTNVSSIYAICFTVVIGIAIKRGVLT